MGFIQRLINLIDKNKVLAFLSFNFIFIFLFVLTYKGISMNMDAIGWQRVGKVIVSTMLFSLMFSVLTERKKEYLLPISCGCVYFLGIAGTFTLYTEKVGVGFRETHYELFFAEALVVMLLALRKIFDRHSLILSVIEIIICSLALFEIAYYFLFGISVNADTLLILFQTNWLEALAFINSNRITFSCFLLAIIAFSIFIWAFNKKYEADVSNKKKILAGVILLVVCIVNHHLVIGGEHLYLHRDFKIAQGYFKQIKMLSEQVGIQEEITSDSNVRTAVIVIGESACRDYMNVYGYERDNTPWMTQNRNNDNFIFFDNTYSSYKLTNKSLIYLLTEKSQYNDKEVYSSLNFIEIAKAAGFKTYWISNQGNISNYRESYNVVAQKADEKRFLEGSSYDEELLGLLDISNGNNKNLIVIHLAGSHSPYKNYPIDFKKFPNDNINDNYDNSILYTDYILQQIFAKLSPHNLDLFIYISDHGEKKGMLRNQFDFRMERIPFVMYCSDDYIKKHNNFAEIENGKHKYFTSDMFYDTFLGLLGINKKFYMQNQNLFSEEYSFDKYNLKTEYGIVDIKNDPYAKN
ncbi:phosphoethanolamine transferase [Phascolarctobacterium faecium]|uniref:phosphoethanolamine transferase n=1 Tax=Phascolarctobacterium faecium TaxID=33025 RepID=UPI00210E10F3|nr:phosphoethanolamine transferase [Phascolarctobacterium faecium]